MASTSRRDLLSAGAVSALVGGVSSMIGFAAASLPIPNAQAADALPAEPHPDAELLILADRFMALQATIDAVNAGLEDPSDDEMARIIRRQARIMEDMHPLIVTTPGGHRARACVFTSWYGIGTDTKTTSEIDHRRLWPILRDLIGEAA